MKITHLHAANLKGKTFTHDLTQPVTVFVGPNGSGKSSRLDAIQLALFGTHPALNKTNEATMQISSGSILSAGVAFDDGSKVANYWSQSKSGTTCRTEGALDPRITPLCLNPSEYFELSDRERTKLVFKLCKSSTNFRAEVVAQSKSIKLAEHDASAEEIVSAICGKISAHEPGMGDSTTEWLESLAEMVKKQVSTSMGMAKRMASTLAGLSELRAMVNQPVNNAAERELATLSKQIGGIDLKIRELETQHKETRKKLARRVEIETALFQKYAPIPLDQVQAELADLEQQASGYTSLTPQLKADLSRLEAERAEKMREHDRLVKQLEQAKKWMNSMEEARLILAHGGDNEHSLEVWSERLDALLVETMSVLPSLADADKAVICATATRNRLQYELETKHANWIKVVNDLAKYDSVEECEHCHWKEKLTGGLLVQKTESKFAVSEIGEKVIAADAAMKSAEEHRSNIRFLYEKRQQDQRDLGAAKLKLAELESKKKWAQQVVSSSGAPVDEIEASIRVVLEEIHNRDNEIKVIKDAIQTASAHDNIHNALLKRIESTRRTCSEILSEQSLRQRLQGELDSLAGAQEPAAGELESLRLTRSSLAARIPELTTQMRQSLAARGEAATKLIAAEEALRVTREEKVWREVKKIVDDVQGKAVQESVGPIIAAANVICDGLLPTPLMMLEGVIGRMGERKFITTDTFNKSDQMIAFSAICVALAGASGCPLKLLLMDDLDNIEDARLEKLIECVLSAIQHGVVSQMIGCSVRKMPTIVQDGMEVVEL